MGGGFRGVLGVDRNRRGAPWPMGGLAFLRRWVPPCGRAYFLLCGQKKVAKEKATPGSSPGCARFPALLGLSGGLRNSGLRPSDSPRPFPAQAYVARRLPRGPEKRPGTIAFSSRRIAAVGIPYNWHVAKQGNTMSDGHRALFASLAAIFSIPVLAWLVAEAVTIYEMFATGAKSRAELGDDFGLGILLFFAVPIGALIGAIGVWFLVWSRTRPKQIVG
jgi:hypothetical protein